jgi:hypothetical protein
MHATDYAAPRISPKIGATSEFNGKINKLTVELGPMQLSAEHQQTAKKAIAVAND